MCLLGDFSEDWCAATASMNDPTALGSDAPANKSAAAESAAGYSPAERADAAAIAASTFSSLGSGPAAALAAVAAARTAAASFAVPTDA